MNNAEIVIAIAANIIATILLAIFLKTNTKTWVVVLRFGDDVQSITLEIPIINGRSYAIRLAEKMNPGWRAISAWRQYE